MNNPIRTGTMIALTAASLFASACSKKDDTNSTSAQPAEKTAAMVHCEGINDCKGHGSCKSARNACAGQNACKGKSFMKTATDEECKTKGGTVVAEKM